MATTCPQCGQSLDQDFGVVSCSHCHSVLVFDLDGNVEIQDASVISQEIHDASESDEPVVAEESVLFEDPIAEVSSEQIGEIASTDIEESIIDQSFEALDQPVKEPSAPVTVEEPFIGEPTIPLVNTSGSVISYH